MSEILISYYVDGPHSAPVGQRIWVDGLAEAFRTSRRMKNEAGAFVTVNVEPGWYRIIELNETQISAVRQAIAEVDIDSIPNNIDTIEDSRTDISHALWRVQYETKSGTISKDIRIAQWGPLAPEAIPLMPLLLKVNTIINTALAAKH